MTACGYQLLCIGTLLFVKIIIIRAVDRLILLFALHCVIIYFRLVLVVVLKHISFVLCYM